MAGGWARELGKGPHRPRPLRGREEARRITGPTGSRLEAGGPADGVAVPAMVGEHKPTGGKDPCPVTRFGTQGKVGAWRTPTTSTTRPEN